MQMARGVEKILAARDVKRDMASILIRELRIQKLLAANRKNQMISRTNDND